MCKAGQTHEAYALAKADMEQQLPWAQREMGWVLYYFIKHDSETPDYTSLLAHLDELNTLTQLSVTDDSIIFESILFKIAMFVRLHVTPTGADSPAKLSALFARLRQYSFESSKGYSFLLKSFIKCDTWNGMGNFIEWWDLNKLTPDDYTPYHSDNGRTIMSVAECAFIAKSKILIQQKDKNRIEAFLPELDKLMNTHPEMTYTGYFYGKLLLSLGRNSEETLNIIVPFVRKKVTEFWAWQLLSDIFINEPDKQLACLLRAVHCHTQEKFLGKVRMKLTTLYLRNNQFNQAKYQIEKVEQCYNSNGWHLPYEVDSWTRQPWYASATASNEEPAGFKAVTNHIIYTDIHEAIAIVTHIDDKTRKVTMVYDMKKSMSQKLQLKVGPGAILKIDYVIDDNKKPRILDAEPAHFPNNLGYAKIVEGTVVKLKDKDFAFLKTSSSDFFIAPQKVKKYNLEDKEAIKGLVVYCYNKKKEVWDWITVSTNKRVKPVKNSSQLPHS